MKKFMAFSVATILLGSLSSGSVVNGIDRKEEKNIKKGVVKAWRLGNTNYCHLKFPRIKIRTLFTDKPQLEDPKYGRLLDYYGPCDHDPLGEIEVEKQREMADQTFRQD